MERVPYSEDEAQEAWHWVNRHGPSNAWTASFGTAARMIGRLLEERERLTKQVESLRATLANPLAKKAAGWSTASKSADLAHPESENANDQERRTMSDDNTNRNAEPSPASAGSLFMITVPLGDGLVGIKWIEDEDKTPGILMRALTKPCDIGAMSPKGNSENFGVFVRCPKLESAQVLLKVAQELCDTLKAKE
jgi:hypothetical protein